MKNLILTFSLLLTFLGTTQIPDYFGNNPRWKVREFYSGYINNSIFHSYVHYEYYIKDTISINGRDYLRIFKEGYLYTEASSFSDYVFNHFDYDAGYKVRQVARKIMYIDDTSNVEKILFDFGQNVGDPVSAYSLQNTQDTVVSLDSVLVGNTYRRIIQTKYCKAFEGISVEVYDNTTFLREYVAEYSDCSVNCYSENGGLKWSKNTYSGCTASNYEVEKKFLFSIYPNPATNEITVSHDYNGNLEYEILDLSGRKLFTSTAENIDVSNLTSGVYLVALKLDGKVSGVEKFVVND